MSKQKGEGDMEQLRDFYYNTLEGGMNFLIRLVASLKAIHLHHHVSQLIKLPRYEICPPTTTLFKTSIKSYYKY